VRTGRQLSFRTSVDTVMQISVCDENATAIDHWQQFGPTKISKVQYLCATGLRAINNTGETGRSTVDSSIDRAVVRPLARHTAAR
jgi:hypothetical protein